MLMIPHVRFKMPVDDDEKEVFKQSQNWLTTTIEPMMKESLKAMDQELTCHGFRAASEDG